MRGSACRAAQGLKLVASHGHRMPPARYVRQRVSCSAPIQTKKAARRPVCRRVRNNQRKRSPPDGGDLCGLHVIHAHRRWPWGPLSMKGWMRLKATSSRFTAKWGRKAPVVVLNMLEAKPACRDQKPARRSRDNIDGRAGDRHHTLRWAFPGCAEPGDAPIG
jgi:hypothetical protein